MVRLRLRRVGRKKQPSYRIVAADRESPRNGRFLEVVGFYNPRTEPETVTFKEDRIFYWLSVGAQPSDSTERIFRTHGLYDRYERFKAGEDIAGLLEEAAAAEATRNVSGKTRHAGKAKQVEAAPEPVVEEAPVEEAAAEEPVAEEEAAPEAAAEEAPVEEAAAEEPVAEETAAEEAVAEEEAAPEAAAEEAPVEEATAEETSAEEEAAE